MVWLGYPHINGDVDITRIQTEIESVPESNSVFSFSDLNELLLFTHCPPSFSPSSHVTKNGEHITAGSESLSELYALVQSRVAFVRVDDCSTTFLYICMAIATRTSCSLLKREMRAKLVSFPAGLSKMDIIV